MGAERTVRLLEQQARACGALGSPLYAALLQAAADDLGAGGPTADVLRGHDDDPGPSALGLRLMGSVHRLVLERRAPALAVHYPSVGGSGADPGAAWRALRALLAEQPDAVREHLGHPPQTNEVGRGAALLGGLLHVAAERDLPVRLVEAGCSGGLNLRVDRFRVEGECGTWGPEGSPVVLADAWLGATPPVRAPLRVVDRLGGDIDPVDPLTTEGRLVLTSYVWADQTARLERLRGALAVAAEVPARTVRAGVAELLAGVAPVDGTWTVVWHSVMWQYVPPEEAARALARLEELGEGATERTPVAHLALEPRRPAPGEAHRFLVTLRTWPGGRERVLGEAAAHGPPVTWAS